jgi:tetratricopeptide (TPR) repeat protein
MALEKINLRLLLWLFVVTAGIGAGLFFLHRFQVKHNAYKVQQLAQQAESQRHMERAVRFLTLYVAAEPGDVDALVHLSELLEKAPPSRQTHVRLVELYEQIVAADPLRYGVRKRLADLDIQMGQVFDAMKQLDFVKHAIPEDGEVDYRLGICHEAQAQPEQARAAYEDAIKLAPTLTDAYLRLANVLRQQLHLPDVADQVINRLVAENSKTCHAYLNRAEYRKEFGLKGAEEDVIAAQKLAPRDPEVVLAASDLAREANQLDEACRQLRTCLETHPGDERLYHALAAIETESGHRPQAITLLRQALVQLPGNSSLLYQLGGLLLEEEKLTEVETDVEEVITEMNRWKRAPAEAALLQAELQLRQGKPAEARELLEEKRPLLAEQSELQVRANLLLGQSYGRLGESDLELAAYRRAGEVVPQSPVVQGELARALLRAGQEEEAFQQFQRLVKLPGASLNDWLTLARLLVVRNLRLPAQGRQWAVVERHLNEMARAYPNSAGETILRAEILAARDQVGEAQRLLEERIRKQPRELESWLALASLTHRWEKPAAAFAILDRAERVLGRRIELELSRLEFVPSLQAAQSTKSLERIDSDLKTFGPEERVGLLTGLATAYTAWQDYPRSLQVWEQLAAWRPEDLAVHLHLFEAALRCKDPSKTEAAVQSIRRLEGSDGPLFHYAEAIRLIATGQQGDKPDLSAAREHLVAAAMRRPSWSRIPLALASLSELEGKTDEVLDNSLRAIELGEHGPVVVREAVRLLYSHQRYNEADQLISRLQRDQTMTSDLGKLAAEVYLRNADPARAVELAVQAVAPTSKDYRDHIWLGQVYAAAGRMTEAEATLRRAVALAEKNPDPWLALVHLFVREQQPAKAEDVLQQARQKLPAEIAPLALAQGYDALGRPEQAEKEFQAAVAARPHDPARLQELANYYQRSGHPEKAIPRLRKILAATDQVTSEVVKLTRRDLAVCLAADGGYQAFQEALHLLSQNLSSQHDRADVLAQGQVYATRAAYRKKAVECLERVAAREPLPVMQQFMLGRLYAQLGDWRKARPLLVQGLTQTPENFVYLSYFVEQLLRHDELSEAELWLDRLTHLVSGQPFVLKLQFEALALRGKAGEIKTLVADYLNETKSDAARQIRRLRTVAMLFDQVSQEDARTRPVLQPLAEEFYRTLVARSGSGKDILALAECLAHRGMISEALHCCEQARGKCPAEQVNAAAVMCLSTGKGTDAQIEQVVQSCQSELQTKPHSAMLWTLLGALRALQGHYADAETCYRQVLKDDPTNTEAMNNLAFMLVIQQRSLDDAQALLAQATELTGPEADLLDTQGVLYAQLGQYDRAIANLEEAVSQAPSTATYLHLAAAYQAKGLTQKVARVLQQARANGPDLDRLLPWERQTNQQLIQELQRS